jgi:hypothetical protein
MHASSPGSESGDPEAARLERQQRLVRLNEQIRWIASTTAISDELPCDFVCECGDPDCHEHFPVPLALYDDLKQREIPLYATGHPVGLARRARLAAGELRAQSKALRAQAELQFTRASRLRGLMPLTVHLNNPDEVHELAADLGETVEIIEPDESRAVVRVTDDLTATLSRIREWAISQGHEHVKVTFLDQTGTLVD